MRLTVSRGRTLVLGGITVLALGFSGTVVALAEANQDPSVQLTAHQHWAPDPTRTYTPKRWTPKPPKPTSTSTSTSPSSTSTSSTTKPPTSTTTATSPTSTTTTTAPPQGWPKPVNVTYSDHIAQWNVLCDDDHYLADDPIVFPGQAGKSHMHTFFGNKSTNATTTTASLFANVSNCGRGMGTSDRSAYWVPSLMKKNADGTLSRVTSTQLAQIYYQRAGGGRGPGVLPFPKGLRMIVGDAKATSDQSLSVVAWDCGFGGLESPHMYQCAGGSSQPMVAELKFPSCWDGVHLDSPDHKSHMAYAARNGTCPSTHPVSLPEIHMNVEYVNLGGGPDYSLASGGIYSMHGDFFAAWDNQVQNALVAACLNGARECANINRDGNTLFRPSYDPEPITINLSNYPTTSPWDGYTFEGAAGAASTTPRLSVQHYGH